VRYDGGLDFVGPKRVSRLTVPKVLGRALLNNLHSDTTMVSGQDVDRIEVRCVRPMPLEADGEDLGDVTEAIFESERNALDVLV
jgi:diacylglycerol kinase family enzyme